MTTQEFFDKWNNQPCNPDGAYGNQCVDVADEYAKDVVGSPLPPVNGAKDFWDKNLVGYDKIQNTPDGVPQEGDIIIWGPGIGSSFGHIAVFKEGDSNSFTSFDQDFPSQGYFDNQGNFIGTGVCHFQKHNDYTGVLGWFHPQSSHDPAIITQPTTQVTDDQQRALSFIGQAINPGSNYEGTVRAWKGDSDDLVKVTNEYNGQLAQNKDLARQLNECLTKTPDAPKTDDSSFHTLSLGSLIIRFSISSK